LQNNDVCNDSIQFAADDTLVMASGVGVRDHQLCLDA